MFPNAIKRIINPNPLMGIFYTTETVFSKKYLILLSRTHSHSSRLKKNNKGFARLFYSEKKDAQVPSKTNVEIGVQVPIYDVSTFMQQEEPIIESTEEEKFQQVSEDLEGALDVEVDSDESATKPFMIHEVDEHL